MWAVELRLGEKAAALRRISLARFNSLISRSICFIFLGQIPVVLWRDFVDLSIFDTKHEVFQEPILGAIAETAAQFDG